MQETLFQERPRHRTVPRVKPTLRVFIACEDKASFFRARRVQRKVEALCAHDINISPMFWAFALLRHDGLRECAVAEAANAEMIVISFRGANELPPHVKCWLENLPSRSQSGQAALVALIKFPEGWAQQQSDIAYLRQIAESRGMDFFCNRDETSSAFALDAEPAFTAPAGRGMTPANLFSSVLPWSAGEAND